MTISLKACDLDKDITITAGGKTITINFAYYAEKALAKVEAESGADAGANLAGFLDAIWTYAKAADAYKAN